MIIYDPYNIDCFNSYTETLPVVTFEIILGHFGKIHLLKQHNLQNNICILSRGRASSFPLKTLYFDFFFT